MIICVVFDQAFHSSKTGNGTEYVNKAYEAFPEEDEPQTNDKGKEWHEEEDDDVESDASSEIDSAYQTLETASSDQVTLETGSSAAKLRY